MKKIMFVINDLKIGGVQTSLLNLLNEIHNLYDVTLLVFNCNGESEKLIPDNVKLIRLNYPFKYLGMSQKDASKKMSTLIQRTFLTVISKVFGRHIAILLMCPFQTKLYGYDVAISFLHEGGIKSFYGGCNEFVLKKVNATKKITWLHCDFKLSGANNAKSKKIYEQFDAIAACSTGVAERFIECMPHLSEKTVAIRNCNNYENIKQLSEHPIQYDNSYFNLITVARLSEEKGIERAIKAVKECVHKGYKIRYHIVGDGAQKSELKKITSELNLNDNVIFYGSQENPYKYMKNADLLVLTSYHEAAPMVFDEAAFLGLPVLATKTTSTDEMISDCSHGFVCDNNDDAISKKLEWILKNPSELKKIKEVLINEFFDNSAQIEKFCTLID